MFKFIVGILFGVVAVIFVMQNVQVIEVTFLAWSISMSRSILFILMLLIGFFLGWLVTSLKVRRRRK
ncbi:MAG TPA: LapA family protein [Sediminispirochaeta sp.]|nr:LapA family protein [Sediminispirochaeta sp.]